ncbi:hypothetical protein C8J56DRAFT_869751 [Mycena floridula]|nr:hypothetical protein C8J56DRAFT_869751 [Mycena floridula]
MSDNKSIPRAVVPYLTKAAHVSAPFIMTFLLIHLSAPIMANLGGSSLSSQTMLLGREYYQSPFAEKYLVLGPIAVHSLAGITKRLLSLSPQTSSQFRPWKSALTLTGYATMLALLPIHFFTHRFSPQTLKAPILALGPSELDYEFIKFGLQTWPWRNWILYGALVGAVAVHAVDGMTIIWNANLAERFGRWKQASRNARIGAAFAGVVLPVLGGLYTLSREPMMSFASMTSRFDAVFVSSWIYRI